MKKAAGQSAEIIREYGPFPGIEHVAGVTYDGEHVWFASGDKLNALDPKTGKKVRAIDVAAHAGTAFDGRTCFSFPATASRRSIRKPAACSPPFRRRAARGSGLAWAEGTLWMGQYREPEDPSNRSRHRRGSSHHRFQPLRHRRHLGRRRALARHSEGDESDLRRVDPQTGEVLERLEMPPGVSVSGLESDGGDRFFCGGESSGKVRAVRRPKRQSRER